jgi:hypothetical protein
MKTSQHMVLIQKIYYQHNLLKKVINTLETTDCKLILNNETIEIKNAEQQQE